MSCEPVLRASGLGKSFRLFERPGDALRQYLLSPLRRDRGRGATSRGRNFVALRDVSFEVCKGESLGIIGRNGAGKSTLLQLICGTLQPTTGTIATNERIAALLELGAGFDPQFTGRENARLNATILGLSAGEIDDKMQPIEAFADIGPFFERPVKTYSSGMYVRLAFAVAIHMEAGIMVIDEALAVGDTRFQAKCVAKLEALKETGLTLLFVSHSVSMVRALCDRCLWLDGGTLVLDGPSSTVTAKYMESLFGGGAAARRGGDAQEPLADATSAIPLDAAPGRGEPPPPAPPPAVRNSHPGLINRWGPHKGAILDAYIVDEEGRPGNCVADNEAVVVQVVLRPPPACAGRQLSVAFTIKNAQGIDLVTGTTWDGERLHLDQNCDMTVVRFGFENCLNSGEYILTVALEDRSSGAIEYLDYVDGIDVIHATQTSPQYGIFVPRLEKSAIVVRGADERRSRTEAA